MNTTPSVTPAQYGAGGIFLTVAIACLTQSVTGIDLLAYLVSSALVSMGLVIADALIRRGRAGIEANRALVEPPADAPVSVDVKAAG